MKKRYNPPVWEMIRIQFRNDLLLTGSVETGGDILDSNNDDIPDVDPDTNQAGAAMRLIKRFSACALAVLLFGAAALRASAANVYTVIDGFAFDIAFNNKSCFIFIIANIHDCTGQIYVFYSDFWGLSSFIYTGFQSKISSRQ